MEANLWPNDWQVYESKSLSDKASILKKSPHTLVAQQFKRNDLERLCQLATEIRKISKSRKGSNFLKQILCDKRAMLYFAQPSSRTYLSFLSACQILGLDTMDVRDSKTSSEIKGESPEDTVRTFSSYVDMIIMRHPQGGFAERVAWMLSHSNREVPVINAGSGADQHPTQALLDIYTLERSFEKLGGIDNKTVMFVGDLRRGRTVRSLSWLLTLYNNVQLIFSAPDELQISKDVQELLDISKVKYLLSNSMKDLLSEVDAVYMTRLQDEWDKDGEASSLSHSDFSLSAANLNDMKKNVIIMHPLPRRKEINSDLDNKPQSIYWRQMRNGMWIRAALILEAFNRSDIIWNWQEA